MKTPEYKNQNSKRLTCKKALVIFTARDAIKLFNGGEGRQIIDYITKNRFGYREYLVNDKWIPCPDGEVKSSRYNVAQYMPEIIDVVNIWTYIKTNSTQPPEKTGKILEQLAMAKLVPEPVTLFSPWGPRYKKYSPIIEKNDPEVETLKEINSAMNIFTENKFAINLLLMPADTYGTEINGLSTGFVQEYFKWLEDWAYTLLRKQKISIKWWSKIKDEQQETYHTLYEKINNNLFNYIGEGEYRNTLNVSKRFNPQQPEEGARKYCIERLVEGHIIDRVYNPIKLSLVKKEKDKLDGPLKRIYLIQNKAPWMNR